jgi:hypothetical protein
LANKLQPLGEKIEWWNLKRDIVDISALVDCNDPYRRVFEKREDHC